MTCLDIPMYTHTAGWFDYIKFADVKSSDLETINLMAWLFKLSSQAHGALGV